MNTSLFVGLCEDVGLDVEFDKGATRVTNLNGEHIATVDERVYGLCLIDTYKISRGSAIKAAEIAIDYAFTPIEERE